MSKFNQGILGGFSGKVGNVVGSSWRGKAVMRAMPQVKKGRVATTSQLAQREKFGLIIPFLTGLKDLFAITFKNNAKTITPLNAAVALNIRNAIAGVVSPFTIDYSKLEFAAANSSMLNVATPTVTAFAGNEVAFNWTSNAGMGRAKASDKAIVVLYSTDSKQSLYIATEDTRNGGELTLDLSLFSGETLESWILFIADDGSACSKTAYTGPVTIMP